MADPQVTDQPEYTYYKKQFFFHVTIFLNILSINRKKSPQKIALRFEFQCWFSASANTIISYKSKTSETMLVSDNLSAIASASVCASSSASASASASATIHQLPSSQRPGHLSATHTTIVSLTDAY